MAQYDSQGFEVGNVLAKLTYPAARLRRPGPPPAGLGPDFDPEALRGSPIRVRNESFVVAEQLGRCLLALGPYVGPGLIKRIDFQLFGAPANNARFVALNLWHNTSAYVTAINQPTGVLPPGTVVFRASTANDQGPIFTDEGGLANFNQTTLGSGVVINHYVPDTQWFLAIVVMSEINAGSGFAGNLSLYEGILPSDYPAILG